MDALARAIEREIAGDVRTDRGTLAAYASDASNHRVVPAMVVVPRHRDDLSVIVMRAREAGVSVTTRGGGTGVAGSALGAGVVIDTSRWLTGIEHHGVGGADVSAEVIVEPGVVLGRLQAHLEPSGRRFGPDPSSASRCTLGGMVGTNACGSHSVAWGTTAMNVLDVELISADGVPRWVGGDTSLAQRLDGVAAEYRPEIGAELGRFERQVSGYGMHYLLDEHRAAGDRSARARTQSRVAQAMVGGEGTLGLISRIRLRTVEVPAATAVLIAGFDSDIAAAGAVTTVATHDPLTIEGFGAELLETFDAHGGAHLRRISRPAFPGGNAWLLIEMPGDDVNQAVDRARAVATDVEDLCVDMQLVADPADQSAVWAVRNRGAGLSTRTVAGREAWPGWEDAAVPPERLGEYLTDFRRLMVDHGRRGVSYGHFGEGCIHIRIDHELDTTAGRAAYRAFQLDAADLVVAHGGSLSGEHGDGRARSELLSRMYSPRMMEGFAAFKNAFDPDQIFNPGVIIDPPPLDADLRLSLEPQATAPSEAVAVRMGFRYPADRLRRGGRDDESNQDNEPTQDNGSTQSDGQREFSIALRRCVGVGSCRTTSGGGMCPSYRATLDERDSTRGRARILYEMLHGLLADDHWQSDEVDAALDTCLGCKACASECPVSVDMATYRAEFLYQRYQGWLGAIRRPRWHYTLGWMPRWLAIGRRAPGLFNRWSNAAAARRLAGINPDQVAPQLSGAPIRSGVQVPRHVAAQQRHAEVRPVVLWVDTFTASFQPDTVAAATQVLDALGWDVEVRGPELCCGLTYLATGQLDRAKKVLRATVSALDVGSSGEAAGRRDTHGDVPTESGATNTHPPIVVPIGVPIVVLEPSCAAGMRHDAPRLVDDDATRRVSNRITTLAELITSTDGWRHRLGPVRVGETTAAGPGRVDVARGKVIAQFHCHQRAVIGTSADVEVLEHLGIEVVAVGDGCCGLAGDFAYRPGNQQIARAAAAQSFEPVVRQHPEAGVIADGISCRTQVQHVTGVPPRHLAVIVRDHLVRNPQAI